MGAVYSDVQAREDYKTLDEDAGEHGSMSECSGALPSNTLSSASARSRHFCQPYPHSRSSDSEASEDEHLVSIFHMPNADLRAARDVVHADDDPDDPDDYLAVLKRLPGWAQPDNIVMLAESFQNKPKPMPIPLGLTAGSAIPLAWLFTLGRWSFFPCYALFILGLTRCSPHGYAHYPWYSWCAWIPIQVICFCIEAFCFRCVAIPKLQVLKTYRIFKQEVPFKVWMGFQFGLSILNCTDMTSDSSFLALQVQSEKCSDAPMLHAMWRSLWKQSLLGYIGMDGLIPSLLVTSIIFWAFNFIQVVYALGASVPWESADTVGPDYDLAITDMINTELLFDKNDSNFNLRYNTMLAANQNHGSALMVLAEANGMRLVASDDLEYALEKADLQYKTRVPDYQNLCKDHIKSQVQRGILHTFLSGTLCNGLQVNLQTTVLAMRAATDKEFKKGYLGQAFLSILLSTAGLVMRVYHALIVLRRATQWQEKLEKAARDQPLADQEKQEKLLEELRGLKRATMLLGMLTFICLFMFLYGMTKLYMVLHCKHAVWNLTGCAAAVHLNMSSQDT